MSDDVIACQVVQRQADAWNAKDAAAFSACYAEDAEVRSLVGDHELLLVGRLAIKASYDRRFRSNPELRVIIEHRHVHDGIVTDLEYFPLRSMRATVIFRVRQTLIDRAWIFANLVLVPLDARPGDYTEPVQKRESNLRSHCAS